MQSAKGLNPFHLTLVDVRDNALDPDEVTKLEILEPGTETAATIYNDPNGDVSVTNPATAVDVNGLKFWCAKASVDVRVTTTSHGTVRRNTFTGATSPVIVDVQRDIAAGALTAGTGVTIRDQVDLGGGRRAIVLALEDVAIDFTAANTTAISYGGALILTLAGGQAVYANMSIDADELSTVDPRCLLNGTVRLVVWHDPVTGTDLKEVGAMDLAISMDTSQSTYFVDATAEGDLGVGSTLFDASEALGTTATDDDIVNAAAYTMAAYADTEVLGASTEAAIFTGT
jgi:hypothetical protein